MTEGKIREKKTINTFRIVYGVLLAVFIATIIVLFVCAPAIKVVDHELNYGYTDIDGTLSCDLIVEFNKEVPDGSLIVKFYDINKKYIETKTIDFDGGSKTIRLNINVDRDVEMYEIIDVEFSSASGEELADTSILYTVASILLYFVSIPLGLFISALTLSCKIYEYEGHEIIVYAGYYKHYIKVDGEKFDEHNTIRSFTPITLSCALPTEEMVKATITLSNRISVKINDRLVKPIKK